MADAHILIVEDEAPIRQMIRFSLTREGFSVSEAGDTAEARVAIADNRPDLVLLDWMLPETSGLKFARELRADDTLCELPIIMVTARVEEEDRVRGLDYGCDDYITKPFSPSELIARIRAVLRRTRPGGTDERLEIDDLVIDRAARRVRIDGESVDLGPTEYNLLVFLAGHAERVYSRAQLLDRVWGQNVYVEERTVDVHVRRLRKALARYDRRDLIQTVRGSGYRLSVENE